MMTQNDATKRQVLAADPEASTWLSANAGSGKTRVLTDRVARLLLQGVDPQRILCLTYTKSAASEMQNRLFRTLGTWAMKPDAELRLALADLGDRDAKPEHLAWARRLFARAIETPGGLRIQTIHSFCASLLRRFPLEAGVSPNFGELDERAGRLMKQDIVEEMALGDPTGLMADLAQHFSGDDFIELMEQVVSRRGSFVGGPDLRLLFGLNQGDTAEGVLADAFLGDEAAWMPEVIAVLAGSGSNDNKAAIKLAGLNFAAPDLRVLRKLEGVFLYSAKAEKSAPFSAKIGAFPTQKCQPKLGSNLAKLEDFMGRVEGTRQRRLGVLAAEKTEVLRRFADAFLPVYAMRKAEAGWLDFDDLIERAAHLLSNPSVAAWVLYRLDGGIDHVLVDEAQDTSPAQWRVIELLTAEFTAGESAHQGQRTLFVVGDQKQSIYSFQGADVAEFDAKHRAFQGRFEAAKQPFQSLKLEYSFRSAEAVLRFVDTTLAGRNPAALGAEIAHKAFQADLPGRVDLWRMIEKEGKPEDAAFEDPVDLISAEHHVARLATQIAAEIKRMLDEGVQIISKGQARPVHAGDFLILVQRRGTLFSEVIRACKKLGLPIAGADRLKLGAEMAVKDLLGLLSFLDNPEDDLALASVLRSPLFGLSEAELFDLAYDRPAGLWEALRKSGHGDVVNIVSDLLDRVDYLRPYDLLERILTRHDGRRRLIARLGEEAEDGIDEVLTQALAYERREVPSLTGFLIWLDPDEIEVKRLAEGEGQRIRVMTVHGAKGLESEIVILPDTATRQNRDRDEILLTDEGHGLWKIPADESPAAMAALREAKKQREAEENLRLFYVAMTRARCWLIVAGAGDAKGEAWHAMASEGMERLGGVPIEFGLRYETGDWPDAAAEVSRQVVRQVVLEPWASQMPAPVEMPMGALTPSGLGGSKVMSGEFLLEDEEDGKLRGTMVHALLEHLPAHPPEHWADLAAHLVPDAVLRAELMDEVQGVLGHTDLFGPGSLAEVPVCGDVAGRQVLGAIDRLVVTGDRVLAVDYKSNSLIPEAVEDVPEGLLRQMGAYHHLLEQIYPDQRIEVAILWTRAALMMPLDAEIVRGALQRSTNGGVGKP